MKLERLLAMVVLLISKKQVQAAELAELFEVSVRTIYRDIETINRAGIPIVTSQGSGGGIGIMETYRLEREWLKEEELFAIASALQSVSSMYEPVSHSTAYKKIKHLIPEQSAEAFKHQTEKWFIDMTAEQLRIKRRFVRISALPSIDCQRYHLHILTQAGKLSSVKRNLTHWFARRGNGIYMPIVWLEMIFAFLNLTE